MSGLSPGGGWQHRQVWRLAMPMILSNISIPLLGLVDTAVVGHLEHAYYLGAVALGALIFSFVFWAFGFLRMGTTGLVAQAYGREEWQLSYDWLLRGVLLALLLALLLMLAQRWMLAFALYWLPGSAPVEHYAAEYFLIRIWSAPASLMNYVLIGWFLGMQYARGPLYLLLVVNISNIVLDLWLVLGLEMSVAGVAWASVGAEYLGMGVGIWLVRRRLAGMPCGYCWHRLLDWPALKRMLVVNQNIFIRTLCLLFSFAFFTAQGARQGDVILAANALLMNFQTFMAYALDGFAHAAEALVGKAIGRKNRQELAAVVRTTGLWSLLIALLFSVLYLLAGQWIVGLLTDIEQVYTAALQFLPWMILMPWVAVWSYWLDGVFIGATRSVQMRNTMLVSSGLVFLPAWYVLQPWGNHGLWAALMIFMLARALTMGWSYRRSTPFV